MSVVATGCIWAAAVFLMAGAAGPGAAQSTGSASGRKAGAVDTVGRKEGGAMVPRTAETRRAEEAPVIDGRLDDGVWSEVEPLSGFVQREPHDGAPASEPTEVRVTFDDEALYVGVRLYDAEPERIVPGEAIRDYDLEPVRVMQRAARRGLACAHGRNDDAS
ncbi:MAG: hypothetical protein ACE5GJ_11845, partial [Gemmatimonadota bacterium]